MTPLKTVPERVTIRSCKSVADFRAMMELQQSVWNYSDLDVAPSHLFVVAVESGGQVLGAFLDNRLVGFTLAYAGEKNGKSYLHSHFAAVLPEYRDLGIGRELKLAQRSLALERGMDRIEWTFDPFQSRNAYLNICRLGAICRHYLPDLYGTTSSPLHAGLPTDRLLAEWNLKSHRVRDILAGQTPNLSASARTVEVPDEAVQLQADAGRAHAILQGQFSQLFDEGYAVTWFEHGPRSGLYRLTRFAGELTSQGESS